MVASHRVLAVLFITFVFGGGLSLANRTVAQPADQQTETDTLTADEAIQRALTKNPAVRSVEQNRSAAEASVSEARSEWFPVVQGQAQYQRLSDNVDYTVDLPSIPGGGEQPVTFAPAILNRYSVRATVEQPVFTGFQRSSRLDAAQAQRRAASAEVDATKQTVVFETRRAYWQLYEARVREEATTEARRQIERHLIDVQNRRETGLATEADVLRVEARRDRIHVEQTRARNDVRSARRALNDQMNRSIDSPVVLADSVTVDRFDAAADELVARAHGQRPDLEGLRQRVRAREAEVEGAQSGWYPQVSLTGSYLYARPNEQLFPPEDRFQGTWQAGVRLSWRLFVGGRTAAATERAQAQRLRARYDLQDRRRSVATEVRTQIDALKQAREAVRAAETSVASAREAHRAVQSRFAEGMVVVSDLLDTERALREARAGLASAEADYAVAQAALARALGREEIN